MLYSGSGACVQYPPLSFRCFCHVLPYSQQTFLPSFRYIGRVELPEANTTFYGAVTIPQQHGTSTVTSTPVNIIAIPTTVDEYPSLVPSVIRQCNPQLNDKFCNANFTTSLCIGWGNPSLNFRYQLPFDPLDRHDFTFEFLSSTAAGSVTVLARCDAPPSPTQFDKTMLALPNTVSKL
jgi:hypothetical protein